MSEITLWNGDCLEEMKIIPDGSIDLVLTDPPYGTTACKWDTVIPFEPMWEQLKRVTKENSAIVLFGSEPFSSSIRLSKSDWFRYDWVWVKNKATGFLDANRRPLKKHEIISVFSKKYRVEPYYPQNLKFLEKEKINKGDRGSKGNPSGDVYAHAKKDAVTRYTNYPSSLIYENVVMRPILPTQKPVALMEYLIKTYTNEGETVLDFTCGSGTTLVAAKNLNRNAIGIELDKDYFEIAKNRINNTVENSQK